MQIYHFLLLNSTINSIAFQGQRIYFTYPVLLTARENYKEDKIIHIFVILDCKKSKFAKTKCVHYCEWKIGTLQSVYITGNGWLGHFKVCTLLGMDDRDTSKCVHYCEWMIGTLQSVYITVNGRLGQFKVCTLLWMDAWDTSNCVHYCKWVIGTLQKVFFAIDQGSVWLFLLTTVIECI